MDIWKGRTAAVVDLDVLKRNVRNVQARLHPDVRLIAVVKANAYGHGVKGIYPTLAECGVDAYAVAIWEEGAQLRELGVAEPIMILGDIREECLEEAMDYRLEPTVFSMEAAGNIARIARRMGIRQAVQIKLDTGMNRIGFPVREETVSAICQMMEMKDLEVRGIFTHFARADEEGGKYAWGQMERFFQVIHRLEEKRVRLPRLHAANSPAIVSMEDAQLSAVRAGDILYGLPSSDEIDWEAEGIQPILSWYTYVAMVKEVPTGTEIGYGGTFVTRRITLVATLPVGFADGLPRELSNRGRVLIRGREAPIIGRICMDQCMVDVTDIPEVRRGDTVTLLGGSLSAAKMAEMINSNVDEIICGISGRVPRVYQKSGGKMEQCQEKEGIFCGC